MLIGNVLPKRGVLTRLAETQNNDIFQMYDLSVGWPDEINRLVDQLGYRWHDGGQAPAIGGRMNRYVMQHTDPVWGGNVFLSLVWFPKVAKGLTFAATGFPKEEAQSWYLRSGDVHVFDHTKPHSVGNQWGEATCVWYFMTECVEEKCDE
jgi:hypothetical protein